MVTHYPCSIGVGDGSGNLFVHGEYDAVKRVQSIILENEQWRAKYYWLYLQSIVDEAQEYYADSDYRADIYVSLSGVLWILDEHGDYHAD